MPSPTGTVLACAAKINEEFARNWTRGLPDQKPATISGGLVIAHDGNHADAIREALKHAGALEVKG